MGKLIRGTSKNARFFLIDSTDVVQTALVIHRCSPTAIDAFGRILTAGAIMGSTLKGKDLITIMTNTDGLLKSMVVTADANGGVKGYLSDPYADVPLKDNKKHDVSGLIGRGTIKIIKDMGLKDPYIGISEIQSGGLAEDLAYYYYTSEQTPTVLALGVSLKDKDTVRSAGGYMIQLLPDAEEDFITFLEAKVKAILPMTDLMNGGMDLDRILRLLYDDMDTEEDIPIEKYDILERKDIKYSCNCNRDKFYRGIIALGKDELNKIFAEESSIETECNFCKKKYVFTRDDLIDIIGGKQ